MTNEQISELVKKVEAMVNAPMKVACEANARSTAGLVTLRVLMQQLRAKNLIDAPALAKRLEEVAHDPHFLQGEHPTLFSEAAQSAFDRSISSFLTDLRN